MATAKNVLGTPLRPCSMKPLTGYFRNGCCDTGADDYGVHTVCVRMTAEFLAFSRDAAGRGRDFARELVSARRERRRLAAGGGPGKAG